MAIKNFLIFIVLVVSSLQDLRTREVSNFASLFLFLIGFIDINMYKFVSFIIITLPFLILNFKNEKCLGAGDVKIIAGISINCGLTNSVIIIAISMFLSSIMTLIKKQNSQPLIPYLLIGYIVINVL